MSEIRKTRIVKDNVPHWKRGGPGWIQVSVSACPKGWVEIDTIESAEAALGNNGSQKRTMLTLDLREARDLRDLINYALGETT
jgi:hypothetical protein